ncbi:ethanolamine ammonia-lyase subunit EutC [Acinetobacter sp. UBA3106]|uniref:ethanolamine ammonia-lyase subunit EutC n=1 Tax=Acinetobacter sp. UBA3106 TaxID=1945936 RepID=UPI001205D5D1|nr:ethanolamine ammonia-lyase subunit EutC [Acinetobacter sp. UBA3106]RZJ22974.1 MAG: ethanolamine ammonia-lyase subunit EutC [Acinetobacter sp.]
MKVQYDVQFQPELKKNAWEQLKQFTDARIALGRAGCSQPTQPSLQFQLAHAQAKDAVLKMLDVESLKAQLKKLNNDILYISSCAVDKDSYLKRPDLGRVLSASSRTLLQQYQQQHQTEYDVLIVAGDGLSARAIEVNAGHFVEQLAQACLNEGWSVAPLVIATGSRVALGDEVAEILKAKMLVMLIGERPGLSSPDSMGIYYTWNAYQGCPDAKRNCISNVRPAGLSDLVAIQRLIALMRKSRQLQFSGVHLKDEHEMLVETHTSSNLKRIF